MIEMILCGFVGVVLGFGGYHQLLKRNPAKLQELLDRARALDDQRRG